ncbi:inorganic diphosphatase [Bradyrhizobium sp. B097]|uniref:inorganic diphosphatase n=1 Tax=Bradyrhizobium sp. B097 TaxID=3140244 RepID=UPI0031831FB2
MEIAFEVRRIGLLKMDDDGGDDEKIIALSASQLTQRSNVQISLRLRCYLGLRLYRANEPTSRHALESGQDLGDQLGRARPIQPIEAEILAEVVVVLFGLVFAKETESF